MSLEELEKQAGEIHFNSILIDCHNDTMLKVIDRNTGEPVVDIGGETDFSIDLSKARRGGLNIGYFAAFTDRKESEDLANDRILSLINGIYYNLERNRDSMSLVLSTGDMKRAFEEERLGILPTIEGAYSLGGENGEELLRQYYDLGVRVVAYVWNQENNLGAGTEGPDDMGLTQLGRDITKLMNELGMVIDVSHMNERTFWDCIEYSESPIMASHSCASGLTPHVRNLTDRQILAIGERGGMVNINYWWELLGRPKKAVSVGSLVDHIDYIVDLIGIDHVGLGSDFDGASMPSDMTSALDLPKISLEMLKRGYDREAIEKILGRNNMEFLDRVQGLASYRLDDIIEIGLDFSMGDSLKLEDLTARLTGTGLDTRIIIDGREYRSSLKDGRLVLDEELELYRGYHVVSFEASKDGRSSRATKIFRYEPSL